MTEQPNFDFLQDYTPEPNPWSASDYLRRQERSDRWEGHKIRMAFLGGLALASLTVAIFDGIDRKASTPIENPVQTEVYEPVSTLSNLFVWKRSPYIIR